MTLLPRATDSASTGPIFGWITTLKFKIMTLAVITGVLSTVATTQLILNTIQQDVQRLILQSDSEESEGTAAVLASKLQMLKGALSATAHQLQRQPRLWQDRAVITRYLLDKPALASLFDSVSVARSDGELLVRITQGQRTAELPNIADRAYFKQAMKDGQLVLSEPIVGKVNQSPLVVMTIPIRLDDGNTAGLLSGTLALKSTSLFYDVTQIRRQDGVINMVVSRTGVVLAHPNPQRILGAAADEPGLADVFPPWVQTHGVTHKAGSAVLSGGHLVSLTGIPGSDWVLVRLTPQTVALQPVMAARQTAWKAAAGVGLVAACLAGFFAWLLTRPISKLRRRAEQMLADVEPSVEGWPQEYGEVGQLAQAFKQVVVQRQQKQSETQALLLQLEAVLEHAEIGIALTRSGHFELVSRHFCHIFQCEKQHALGQPTRMIHPSDEAYQALSTRAHPSFMAHGAFDGEVELMRRSGEHFWAHMRGRAVVPGDRTKGTIWTVEDITHAREQRERLTWTSSHDSLTGLANRPAFEVLLEDATARAGHEPFCAMFIDLDHFKQVNDTGGHAAGDALLRDVAHALAAQVRQSDTVARLGGDEFAVLLSGCPLHQAQDIAEKLRSAVVAYRLLWEGNSFGVGASIGLVLVNSSFDNAADVLRAADAACYAAKQQGRNSVALFDARHMHTPELQAKQA